MINSSPSSFSESVGHSPLQPSTPKIKDNESPEDYFRRLYPNNVRIQHLDPIEQTEILCRAQRLVKASRELAPEEEGIEYMCRDNPKGICCHPIFLTISEAKRLEEKLENELFGQGQCSPRGINSPYSPRTPYSPRDPYARILDERYYPSDVIAKILVDSGMVQFPRKDDDGSGRKENDGSGVVTKNGQDSHPLTYPEVFRHQDLIGLVDIPLYSRDSKDCSDSDSEELVFKFDEIVSTFWGWRAKHIYLWLETEIHPEGYPHHILLRASDEEFEHGLQFPLE